MKYLFLKYNCHIDAVYHCPFHPSKGVGKYLKDSFDTDMVGPYGYCADISRAFVVGNKFNDEQKNYIQWQLNK